MSLLAALASATASAAPAAAQEADRPAANPCHDPALDLRCPDLRMAPPTSLWVQRVGGRVRLHATNRIVNVGEGPLELLGHRTKRPQYAEGTQIIFSRRGIPHRYPGAGDIYWKFIPGQGHYWKYYRAARFELWSLHADGTRATLRRTGPKLSYCFRDLRRVRSWPRTPRARVYPACSQVFARRDLRLGVSPGWADIYPSTYDDNWISITGLHGCFAFVHRADPQNTIFEADESNNLGQRIVRLPPVRGSVAPRGCPPAVASRPA